MQLRPLAPTDLSAARAVLAEALPHDHLEVTAEEKLFGDDGARAGRALGVWSEDRLVGVGAGAGRWIKVLGIAAAARGRGYGSALLAALRSSAPAGERLRVGDHPGNYVSPGLDVRYAEGAAFLSRRGFREVAQVENLRAPLENNPLVSEARSAALDQRAAAAGYRLGRVSAAEAAGVCELAAQAFAPVWALELGRALAGPRAAVHAAFFEGAPVAFAAADGNNQGLGWFGPAGSLPAHRGRGLGEALLLRCLLDVRGLPEAGVIAWIGPRAFYQRSCGAGQDRRFTVWEEERS